MNFIGVQVNSLRDTFRNLNEIVRAVAGRAIVDIELCTVV